MKVLIIASTDDSLGGAKSLLELVELLKEKKIQIVVVNPFHNDLNVKLNEMKIENYSVGYHLNICRKDCGENCINSAAHGYRCSERELPACDDCRCGYNAYLQRSI